MSTIKSLVKRVVPDAILSPLRRHYWNINDTRSAEAIVRAWEYSIAKQDTWSQIEFGNSALIVPADQNTIFGSRGEDAMVTAITSFFLRHVPHVDIVANAPVAIRNAESRGYSTHRLGGGSDFIANIDEILQNTRPKAVAVIGADVIDGHYGAALAAGLLIFADMAARHGIPTTVTGFSFNKSPSPHVIRVLDQIHPSVRLNLREPISLERFRQKTKAKAESVADCAFMLVPDRTASVVNDIRAWAETRRAAGRSVIAFNCHPLFRNRVSEAEIQEVTRASINALLRVSQERSVSWLLLPHDNRDFVGDDIVLRPMLEALKKTLGDDVHYLEGTHTAAVLKAVVSNMDGVATGRMHLAIGAIGSGVPTAGLTYQDKFEGLWQLLGLPQKLLVPIERLLVSNDLEPMLFDFIDNLDQHRSTINQALPSIKKMSEANVDALFG